MLVTGAGSGVGQGIIKALRISKLPITIVGSDIALMNAALYRADEALLIPKVEYHESLGIFIDLFKENDIHVVMIGSEFEVKFFSENKKYIETVTNTKVIVAPSRTVEIADDKWLTVEFLKEHGLPYPETIVPLNLEHALEAAGNLGYPLMLKARQGTSSRHVYLVQNATELKKLFSITPLPLLQKVIQLPSSALGHEYTCSVFKRSNQEMIGPFTARRTVRSGTSWHIEVAPYGELYEVLFNIAKNLNYVGSLNIQLMLSNNGPVTFEINARFSGTTAVRAKFGFNEPEMVLRDIFYGQEVHQPVIETGIAIRYNEEVFIEGVSVEDLSISSKGVVNSWF